MKIIEKNDIVTLTFIGTLDNGEQFMVRDSEDPITITIGESDLPPSVENGIIGLMEGQTRKITVSPDEGYGARQKNLLQVINNKEIIERLNPRPGMIISLTAQRDGEDIQVPATVMEVNEDGILIDYNHPLAGHNLTYQITILSIVKGTN